VGLLRALDAAGLLVPNQAVITVRSDTSLRLEGFKVIVPAKFDAVDDAQFLDWRQRGWLTLISAHQKVDARGNRTKRHATMDIAGRGQNRARATVFAPFAGAKPPTNRCQGVCGATLRLLMSHRRVKDSARRGQPVKTRLAHLSALMPHFPIDDQFRAQVPARAAAASGALANASLDAADDFGAGSKDVSRRVRLRCARPLGRCQRDRNFAIGGYAASSRSGRCRAREACSISPPKLRFPVKMIG
jgi:hypothetical protein